MNSLVEKHLIEEAGRLELPGRPISYRTTDVFLRSFGLESLEQLPEIRNSNPSSSEQPETEKQMTLEQI